MKRYIRSAQDELKRFCQETETRLVDELRQAGVTNATLDKLFIDVRPAGSGFRINIQLPARVFHGRKISEFCYRRDVDAIIEEIVDSSEIQDLINRQSELRKRARKQSSTALAVREARNTDDVKVLQALAQHNASTVRTAVADNPHTPSRVLYKLACDPEVVHRSRNMWEVFKHMHAIDLYNYIFDRESITPGDAALVFASRKDAPYELLKKLMHHIIEHPEERNSHSSSSILSRFASRTDLAVEDYQELLDLGDSYLDWSLALNAGLNDDIYEQLIDRHSESSSAVDAAVVREATNRLDFIHEYSIRSGR